ncbi:MAG: hypothetical protein LBL01_07995, partial [Bifidobacteriaceae bacterium]|nr:hypothetical protein [Bifidobacteriaceae bacterium]
MNADTAPTPDAVRPPQENRGPEALDPSAALAISQTAAARANAFVSGGSRFITAIWGAVWLVDYGLLWLTWRDAEDSPPAWAFVVFFGLLAAGMAASAVVGIRSSTQIAGPSAKAGALYGWSWFVAFAAVMSAGGMMVDRYHLTGPVVGVVFNTLSAALAGALYMAGGAMFREAGMFAVGAVMTFLAPLGVAVGLPDGYLVMGSAGGGLMLLSFAVLTWQARRS